MTTAKRKNESGPRNVAVVGHGEGEAWFYDNRNSIDVVVVARANQDKSYVCMRVVRLTTKQLCAALARIDHRNRKRSPQ
jgi:hypothetical protein